LAHLYLQSRSGLFSGSAEVAARREESIKIFEDPNLRDLAPNRQRIYDLRIIKKIHQSNPMPPILFLLFLVPSLHHAALAPLSTVRIGAQFPIFKSKNKNYAEDGGGRRRQAAFLLALHHINDKHDGFYDEILPNTTLQAAFYDSKRDEGVAVVNAFRLWNDFDAAIAVGPASSGPSKQAQQVLKVPSIAIPQVAYSATSDQLSDVASYPMFIRTPPSDAFQANVMAATIKGQQWRHVCVIAGTDAYSSAGAQALISQLPTHKLMLKTSVNFETGTASVAEQITQLKLAGCRLVVLWAQASDIQTIALEADSQGFNSEDGILWFSSELMLGAMDDICVETAALCKRVFKGSLLVTPNYGPGSGKTYERLADAWHGQTSKVGTPKRTDLNGCDDATDARGANHSIWVADHDNDPSTPKKCTAVDFSDYDKKQAGNYEPETSGDGKISTYVPYAYDVALVVAHGLHSLFTSTEWKDASSTTSALTGSALYNSLLRVHFEGFSGNVKFRQKDQNGKYEGDREADKMEFFLWNYDGGTFQKVGSINANGTFAEKQSIVWPGDGSKPDDRPRCTDVDYNRTMSQCDETTEKLVVVSVHDSTQCRSPSSTTGSGSSAQGSAFENATSTVVGTSNCLYTPTTSAIGITVVVLSCLGATLQVVALIYAWVHRTTKTMKASQYELLFLFQLGLLMLSFTPIPFLGAPTNVSCVVRIWFMNVSVSLTNGALVVKMWRVWKVFNNKKMKRQKLKTITMIRHVCCFVLFEIVLLVVMTFVPDLKISPIMISGQKVFPKLLPTGQAMHGLCGIGGISRTSTDSTLFTVSGARTGHACEHRQ
jgi:ABC-type branched-subunit amino acid transport system substrate-binding protein